MISERDVARRFSSVWTQVFPLLAPNFMSKFNQSKLEAVWQHSEVESKGHPDVVSEMAFNIARIVHTENLFFHGIRNNAHLLSIAFQESIRTIQSSARVVYVPDELEPDEIEESILLAENIVNLTKIVSRDLVEFGPKLPGYGPINSCVADVSLGDTLFEVKTVNRNFRSKDLKQLLVYAALASVAGIERWRCAGLYNPRTCQYCKFEIENLVRNLSAYSTSKEAFQDLLELFVRDVQIDKPF